MCAMRWPILSTTSTGTPSARRRTFATSMRSGTNTAVSSPTTEITTMAPVLTRLSSERQYHPKRRALSRLRFDLDARAVRLGDALDDRQPQARPRRDAGGALGEEAAEDPALVLDGDA